MRGKYRSLGILCSNALALQTDRRAALAAAIVTCALLVSAMPGPAAPPTLSAGALRQVDALSRIRDARTAVEQKIDTALHLGLLRERRDQRLAPLTDFRFVRPEADGRLRVNIALASAGGLQPVLDWLAEAAAPVEAASAAYQSVTARVRFEDLEPLAALPAVRKIGRQVKGLTNQATAIVSEGVATHDVALAREIFGVAGVGVKVCVLADGVDSLAVSQASGELPASVDVLAGQAGSGNEGTAMLEIVHDLAPQADLGFATAGSGHAQFAQNILDLAADGCHVMVDAMLYPDESPFQDGPIAQAVDTVTSAGVAYFSAAGDDGNANDGRSATWEGDFNPNGEIGVLAGGGPVHNFGDGGQSIGVTGTADFVVLTWAEHSDLNGGLASTDYDLYILNQSLTTVFDASTDVQDGDDRPVEVTGAAFGNERLVVARFQAGSTTSAPMFNLIAARGTLDPALATGGATRGHSAAAGAFSVAAATATPPTGPFPGLFTAANVIAPYSSDGPRRIILHPDGSEITPGNRTSTGGVVRQKPDLTAADGVSTSVPGFAPFVGTSAAAPHAAAIAALMKSAVPTLTPAQLRSGLLASAIDIEAAGVDRDSGAGIVMAPAALEAIGAAPRAFLTAAPPVATIIGGDGDAAIEPNEVLELAIPLTNVGGFGATAVTAALATTTPGVVIAAAASTYPDLASGTGGSNTTPFRVKVIGASCAATIEFTLTVAYSTAGSKPDQSFPFSLRVGGPGTSTTFSYTDPAVPIPDGGDLGGGSPGAVVAAPLTVSGTGVVWDVDVRIDGAACSSLAGASTVGISHTFVNDLKIGLVSPSGTSILLINQTDGSGNNLCQTLLDDQSTGPSIQTVISAQAPFSGNFKPNQSLSAFNGQPSEGSWQLTAQDFFSQDTGNIRAWSLLVTGGVCDAPDQPPTVIAPPDQATLEDQALGPIVFTVGDALTDPDALLVSATSSNQAVVAASGLALGGSGTTRTLTITPIAGVSGETTITLQVSDGTTVVSDSFLLLVTPVNDAPTLSPIAPQTIAEDGTLAPVGFTIGDVDHAVDSLVVSATSSNVALVPNEALVIGGSGAARTVSATPALNQSGETTITVSVTDGAAVVSSVFLLRVTAVNDGPTISSIAPQTVAEDGALSPLAFAIGDADPADTLVVSATSSNVSLVPNEALVIGGSGAARTIGATPSLNQSGETTIMVTVTDGAVAVSSLFVLTVTPVNDPPTISTIAPLTIPENGTLAPVAFTIGDVDNPVGALAVSASSSNVALVPIEALVLGGAGEARTIGGAPLPNRRGETAITIAVSDGAERVETTFVLTVAPATTPLAPTALLASTSSSTVTLAWTPPATGTAPVWYVVETSTTPFGTTLPSTTIAAPQTTLALPLAQGTYFFRVRSATTGGLGGPSNEAVATVGVAGTPGPPTALDAVITDSTVSMSWQAPTAAPAPQAYRIEVGTALGRSDVGVFPGPVTTAAGKLDPGTYFVRVRAVAGGIVGAPTNEVSFTIGGAQCTAAPSPPVLLTPSIAPDFVTLAWLAPATGDAATYRLTVGSTPGAADLLVIDTPSSSTSIRASTPAARTYYLTAQARNACGVSGSSNTVAAVVPTSTPRPAAPVSLHAQVTNRMVAFAWAPPPDGASPAAYLLEAGSLPGLADYAVVPVFSGTNFSVSDVPPGAYLVRVRAVTAGGAGPASNEILVVVP